ncbi:hypothetical protein [Cronobacter sakazakii]|uniref:hypothetical protein n=1 Tax=Cronobacter sakazakii TaxID=28141 RepID=UPI00029C0377|nr:hypothetical protein [Cronobacter sakazakii]CCK08336.1 FIG00642277: hypothetical protein [Cronobacter sakazakii 696]EKK3984573.1 hypothetical protein [Cronobacter sakazakii]ELY2551287.1 hypothetical protein [Cronobacter sakazakii]ELY6002784.1 hypothetical protein [Cronobacter sakazakii]ELY6402372.1 hypothetical protein [Cronobacter sakazakii]
MADEKAIKPLAEDDPRRQRYAELLAEAQRVTVPRLQPDDADGIMCQLAALLGAPVPSVGSLTEHAVAWCACLLAQGLGELLEGNSKQVLTIFFLLCWRDSALRLAGKQKERLTAASEGLTIEQYRAMHPAYREDKEDDNHN